ncbi:hypothetical protein [Cupriavidus numazuensis]|nr:hypothetical protein [Cupriavidus numazuensis]
MRQPATWLDTGPLTARKQIEKLMRKLNAYHIVALTVYAVRHGVVAR